MITTRQSKVWDQRFMEMAGLVSTWSKDPNTKVGCVVVGPKLEIRTVGYNGMPRGVSDDVEERLVHPVKGFWWECAERNAIYNACRMGLTLEGCTLYLNGDHGFPCSPCARAIVQSGIEAFVGLAPDFDNKYGESYRQTILMWQEAGVSFRSIKYEGEIKRGNHT